MTRTISQVARTLGIHVETIRFYERRGLIRQPPKPAVGYRHYPDETIKRIRFIKRAQALGFTLDEIGALLHLNDQPCQEVQSLALARRDAVRQQIRELQRLEDALNAVLNQCERNDDKRHCPVIDALS